MPKFVIVGDAALNTAYIKTVYVYRKNDDTIGILIGDGETDQKEVERILKELRLAAFLIRI